MVPWQGEVLAWHVATLDELTPEHFERVAALQPEVVIFGTGARLRFARPALMRALRCRLGVPVAPVEAEGWDGDALEAQCFGYLAARVEAGLPLSWPGTTGVGQPTRGGRLIVPD